MIGQYSCSAAASSRVVVPSDGGYNNYGYLATTEKPRMRPVIYPPQRKLSYSPSMRELTTSSCYYGNNSSNNSDFHSNQLQPLNPANLDILSEETERNRFQPNEKIKFPVLPPKIGSDRRHYWRDDSGSDVIVTSSLPRRQTRALPQRHLTRHSSLNLQTHRQTDRPRNIAVVEPSRSVVYQGQIRRAQNRSQQSPPWQPQEIRSQIAWQPLLEGVSDKPLPWEPNQQHIQQSNNMLPRQQQQLNDMLPRQQQTEEEDVAYMGLQDHYDWIKQQQALLLQQREVSRQQQLRLQNYVHLSDQNGFHGNNVRNGDNTVVANSNYVSQLQLETSFANQPNQSGSSSEIYSNHSNRPRNQPSNHPSNRPPVPKKTFKSHGVLVLPELLPGQQGKLNQVARESSTDDNIDGNHDNNGNGNLGDALLLLSRTIHHERFRSISPLVEYLNDGMETEYSNKDGVDIECLNDVGEKNDVKIKNVANSMETQNSHDGHKMAPVTLILWLVPGQSQGQVQGQHQSQGHSLGEDRGQMQGQGQDQVLGHCQGQHQGQFKGHCQGQDQVQSQGQIQGQSLDPGIWDGEECVI